MARIHIPVHLRWGDLDAYNHLNNVQSMRILEEARVRAFWRMDAEPGEVPSAVLGGLTGDGTQTLIASHHVEYLLPVPYQREPLEVQLWLSRIGGADVEIGYEVFCHAGLAFRATTTMVFTDAATGRPLRMDRELRAVLESFAGDAVEFRR